MMVYDIPDLQCGGNLGSVVFSESFLESSVYIQQRGKNPFSDRIQLSAEKHWTCDCKACLFLQMALFPLTAVSLCSPPQFLAMSAGWYSALIFYLCMCRVNDIFN